MEREIISPASETHWLKLRSEDITSSDVSALYGLCPYKTQAKLWHEKSGTIEPDVIRHERAQWGLALEHEIAKKVMKDADYNPSNVIRKDEYIRIPELRIGSSFDFQIGDELVEVKNVDGFVYRRDWTDSEAPPHIELQVQHQMLVSGLRACHICALVNGNKGIHIYRLANDGIAQRILKSCEDFWVSVDRGIEPEMDESRDVGLSEMLSMGKRKKGKVLIPDEETIELARSYTRISGDMKKMDDARRKVRDKIIRRSRDASKLSTDAVEITLKPFRVKWRQV